MSTLASREPATSNDPVDPDNLAWVSNEYIKKFSKIIEKNGLQFRKTLDALPVRDAEIASAVYDILKNRVRTIGVDRAAQYYLWNGRVHVPANGDKDEIKLLDAIAIAVPTPFEMLRGAIASEENIDKDAKKELMGEIKTSINNAKNYMNSTKKAGLATALQHAFQEYPDLFSTNRYMVFNNRVLDTEASAENLDLITIDHLASLPVSDRNSISTDLYDYSDKFDIRDFNSIGAANIEQFVSGSFASRDDGVNLLRATGVALFSSSIKLKCVIDMYGRGNDGKSMYNRIIKALAEGQTENAGADFFGKKKDNYAESELKGQRLIFSSEMESVGIDQTAVKEWSGGDMKNVRQKFKSRVKFRPEGMLFFVSNIKGGETTGLFDLNDFAMYQRYFPIHFSTSFSIDGSSRDNEDVIMADKGIETRIIEEELPQLAYILLHLWLDWEKAGYEDHVPLTPNQARLREMSKGSNDFIQMYLDEGLEQSAWFQAKDDTPMYKMLTFSTFWKAYKDWYEKATNKRAQRNKILDDLRDRGMITEDSTRKYLHGYTADSSWKFVTFMSGIDTQF